ncbi:MAG TPA: DUF6263 family protein [Kofleriaceae bacterium]|jgi:hypothetical protein
MIRSALIVVLLGACGGGTKPVPVALPPDKPTEPVAQPKEEPAQPKPDPQPETPKGPVDVGIPGVDSQVKLVKAGAGKKGVLKYAPKAGDKQSVELALDYTEKDTQGTESREQTVPTVVLQGDVVTNAVGADGKADYVLTVTGTDAREVKESQIKPEQMKVALATLAGVTFTGSTGANGAAGEIKVHIEKVDAMLMQALELVRLTLPRWPMLPAEPVGVGAKWQSVTNIKLGGKFDVTETTDYELTAHKGKTWTIKGTTKLSGPNVDVEDATVSDIGGSGTTEATITDGMLYPAFKTQTQTQFTAKEKVKAGETPKTATFSFRVGGAVTPAAATPVTPAPAKK